MGTHRALPAGLLRRGTWRNLPDGQRVWTLAIRSPGARAIRLHFDAFETGGGKVFLYAASDTGGETAAGPYSGRGPNGDGEFWSDLVFSDAVVLEYVPGDPAGGLPFRIDRISHGFAALLPSSEPRAILDGAEPRGPSSTLNRPLALDGTTREAAAACHLDVSCYAAYRDSSDAVALLQTEDAQSSYVCSGFLINTRASSLTPYVLTAAHCVPDQATANTVAAFWRYRTASCNGAPPAFPAARSTGATLLATRPKAELDFAFLRLPAAPSTGFFLGWSLSKPAAGSSVTAISYPDGSYERITMGVVDSSDKFGFHPVQGLTEAGSSGAPWMSGPGQVVALHTSGNAGAYLNACSALANGRLYGAGEWFADIYPIIQAYLEDAAPCSYSISPQTASFSSSGGSGSAAVAARVGCAWSASSGASWLAVTAGASGSGNGTVSYTVAANTTGSFRSGTIAIAGQTLTVTQAAASASCPVTALTLGAPASGVLSSSCRSQLRAGRNAARYSFQGAAGKNVVIEANSTALDAYLILQAPDGSILAQNDDGATGSDARIPAYSGSLALSATGTYTVEVTSYAVGETGGFTARVSEAAGSCAVTTLTGIGTQTVNGLLNPSDCLSPSGDYFADFFAFQGTAGQQISVLMTSTTMDTYLVLTAPDGNVLAEDDDSAGNLNARIPASGLLTLPATGTYTIEASTFDPFATGAYQMVFTAQAPPVPANGPYRFVAVTPCRVLDTRNPVGPFGGPVMSGPISRDVPVTQSACGIPSDARAYSLNITVVPRGSLGYLTVWPAGQSQPLVSTLNSYDGRVVANAAIVPAGLSGAISVFVTNTTDVIIDINGFFAP